MVDPITISAIGWGMTALNWLVSPIFSTLINKCLVTLGGDLPTSLQHLETTVLPQLKIIMEAAQQSPHSSALEKQVDKLKEAFYEVEDMLDLVEYERLEKEVKSDSSSKIVLTLKSSSRKKNLLKSLQKLEKLVNDAIRDIVPLINLPGPSTNNEATSSARRPYRVTTSSPPPLVIGRDEDRDHIIKMLHEDSVESSTRSKCFSVIGVYGVGGSGKTTLAQYVCEYERKSNCFDFVMWVYVSREFDVYTILSKMWESVYGKSCGDFKNLDVLQNQLKGRLIEKKFLLVLDDVWCNKGVVAEELDQLLSPLRVGKRGSKILVTTRMEDVAKVLGSSNPIKLRELDHEQLLALFMHYALGDALTDDKNLEKEFKMIGEKIAKKLHKSPLAARIVAGQLSKRLDPTFWSSMLSKNLLTDFMGALYLSYQHLDPNLQRCFVFFSLFPKGFSFYSDDLLEYWISEQFIEIGHDEHVRDVARSYLHELISSSFISQEKKGFHDRYFVHDVLHDFAEMVTKNEYSRIENGERKEISMRVQHLFVDVDLQREHIENICKLEGLRTLIIDKTQSNLKYNDLYSLFLKLKKLRVVQVDNSKTTIPKSVAYLKHLRYLRYFTTDDRDNTRQHFINQLYHLCFLYTDELISSVPYFGRLRSIQTISEFEVRKNNGIKLKQLENLRELYGSLKLLGLQNVPSKEEAFAAQLSNKHGIKKLTYGWNQVFPRHEEHMRQKDLEILEGLCPPTQITRINIHNYQGQRYPNWIININNSANNLDWLELHGCNYLESLPKSLVLLPQIRSLSIIELPRLRSWQPLPITLTMLSIVRCFSLSFISKKELEMVEPILNMQMPEVATFLKNFDFNLLQGRNNPFWGVEIMIKATDPKDLQNWLDKRFDLIRQLGDVNNELILPSSLESFHISSSALHNSILCKGLQGTTSLTTLYLKDIITITSIPKEMLSSVNKLQILKIIGCLFLKSIGGLEILGSLKELEIIGCPILTLDTTKAPSSLENLTLGYWRPPDGIFGGLVSLQSLDVCGCPSIVSPYIGCSKSLKKVSFKNCSNLNSIRGLNELSNLVLFWFRVWECPVLACHPMDDRLCMPPKSLDIDELSLVQKLLSIEAIASLQCWNIIPTLDLYVKYYVL